MIQNSAQTTRSNRTLQVDRALQNRLSIAVQLYLPYRSRWFDQGRVLSETAGPVVYEESVGLQRRIGMELRYMQERL